MFAQTKFPKYTQKHFLHATTAINTANICVWPYFCSVVAGKRALYKFQGTHT